MTDQSSMSGAELKVHMTGLGLTSQWLATRTGANVRTVLRWYDTDRVPAEAVAAIDAVTEHTTQEMTRLAHHAGPLRTHRTDLRCSELNTLPASWHRALTYRVLEYRRSHGVPTAVTY